MPARRIALGLLDGFQYGFLLAGVVFLVLAPVSLVLSGDLVLVKVGLFVVGLLSMGVGAAKARPAQPQTLDPEDDWRPRLSRALPDDSTSEDGFAGVVNGLPPAAWYVAPDDRLSDGYRFLAAWIVTWGISYCMEAVFHVGVPPPLR